MNDPKTDEAMEEYKRDFGSWHPLTRQEAIAAGFPAAMLDGSTYEVMDADSVNHSVTVRAVVLSSTDKMSVRIGLSRR